MNLNFIKRSLLVVFVCFLLLGIQLFAQVITADISGIILMTRMSLCPE